LILLLFFIIVGYSLGVGCLYLSISGISNDARPY